MLVFEDETTITQKPCIRKSMSFQGEQQKIEHNGSSRNKFSTYISMLWPDQNLMYDFYDAMNSKNTIDHLENLRKYVMTRTLLLRSSILKLCTVELKLCIILFVKDSFMHCVYILLVDAYSYFVY